MKMGKVKYLFPFHFTIVVRNAGSSEHSKYPQDKGSS